jgi:hypothetical protein
MAIATVVGADTSLPRLLIALFRDPRATFPALLARRHPLEVMALSAVSGVYVAYVGAERLHIGDALGFSTTLLLCVFCGAGLGLLALSFVDVVLTASSRAMGGGADRELFASVFGYATLPFVPLLLFLMPLEMGAYGDALFSSVRPDAPGMVPLLATGMEALAIGFWLYLMVEGTSVAGELSEVRAAETVGLMFVRMAVIAVLAIMISLVSFLI